MPRLIIIFVLTWIIFLNPASGQFKTNNKGLFSGRIVDEETHKGLAFITIWNESKRIYSISDTSGVFKISADIGDTLAFVALGYFGKAIPVTSGLYYSIPEIILSVRTYDIAEVQIIAFRNYADFKQKFINLKLPETQTKQLRTYLNELARDVAVKSYEDAQTKRMLTDGFTIASVPILTPEEIQRIKLKEIVQEEKTQEIIDKKFNRQIVADLTKLEDKELDDFMLFCKFEKKYLLQTSQYDIMIRILEKFEEFKRLKNSGINKNILEFA